MFLEYPVKYKDVTPCDTKIEIFLASDRNKRTNRRHFSLKKIELKKNPLISFEQILSYDPANHSIEINEEARVSLLSTNYPAQGLPFYITLNNIPLYNAFFWPSHSSIPCNWVVADPYDLYYSNKIQLKLGYPGIDNFLGRDPRNNQLMINAFRVCKKLKRQPIIKAF